LTKAEGFHAKKSYKNNISGRGHIVRLSGRLYIRDYGAGIKYINNHNGRIIKAFRCRGCGQICSFTWFRTSDTFNYNVIYHRKCGAGELFKFYKYGYLPRTLKCAILAYAKWVKLHDIDLPY
jgi:hypothetical protein